ncbi:hypothetical protein ATZ89_21035 [Salmonella enterica subsp. enterica serovar Heidelberg]|nr:hypothetical protein [Salmonella enterica subsp. enterica serovar Heidelberg]
MRQQQDEPGRFSICSRQAAVVQSLAAGRAASAVTAWAFSVMLGTPVGILGFAIIMAAVSALVNDKFIEQVNKLIGI